MVTPREAHTAVLLADGNVLIAGGEKLELHIWLNSAKLYSVGSGN